MIPGVQEFNKRCKSEILWYCMWFIRRKYVNDPTLLGMRVPNPRMSDPYGVYPRLSGGVNV
jgi:hypothetical protein